jgi:hypothetical protein
MNGEGQDTSNNYVFEDQILTEIEVDDAAPMDDESTVWSEEDNNEMIMMILCNLKKKF